MGENKKAFEPKLVLFDLDGTLLNKAHEILPCSIQAIKSFRQNGVEVCITTGRCLFGTRKVLQQLPSEMKLLVSIHNGAAVLDGDKLLHEQSLPMDLVIEVVKLAQTFKMQCSVQTLADTYVDEDLGPYKEILDAHDISPVRVESFSQLGDDKKVLKIAIFDLNDKLKAFTEAFQKTDLPAKVNLFQSGSYFADATSAKASKRFSGEWLAKHFKTSPEFVLAFGDQMNDSDMLKWAGKGVAMGNANPLLHAFADHITECHNSGGISRFVKESGYI